MDVRLIIYSVEAESEQVNRKWQHWKRWKIFNLFIIINLLYFFYYEDNFTAAELLHKWGFLIKYFILLNI